MNLFRANRNPVALEGIFYGQSCFLVLGGPSTKEQDLSLLNQRGIISCAVNNVAAKNVRPNLWVCGDDPQSFCENIWLDPTIMKFISSDLSYVKPMDSKGNVLSRAAHAMPNTFIFDKISSFSHSTFLEEPYVSWGQDSKTECSIGLRSGRSVMLATLKILYWLGFTRVYLLGADFFMQSGEEYSFDQHKTKKKIAINNAAYRILAARLEALQPMFVAKKFLIANCTPNSKLNCFPKRDYIASLQKVLNKFPKDVRVEDRYLTKKS